MRIRYALRVIHYALSVMRYALCVRRQEWEARPRLPEAAFYPRVQPPSQPWKSSSEISGPLLPAA